MRIATYLKKLLSAYVDEYVRYFSKTYGLAVTLTLFCFIVILILVSFTPPISRKQVSVLSYFYFRYSKDGVYCLIDLSKTVYLFFVALLSLTLCRVSAQSDDKDTYITISKIISMIKWGDLLVLFLVLLVASAVDFGLVSLEGLIASLKIDFNLKHYINYDLFFIRIYSPLFLFSLTIYKALTRSLPHLNLSKICLLLISFWIINEFTYESFLLVRNQLFDLLLLPFSNEKVYLIESILGLFLMAVYFVGYHIAMTVPFKIFEEMGETSEVKSAINNPTS